MPCLYLIKSQLLWLDKWTKPYLSMPPPWQALVNPVTCFFSGVLGELIHKPYAACWLINNLCFYFHKSSQPQELAGKKIFFPFWWAICIRHSANGLWVSVGVLSETMMVDIFRAKKKRETAERLHSIAYDSSGNVNQSWNLWKKLRSYTLQR